MNRIVSRIIPLTLLVISALLAACSAEEEPTISLYLAMQRGDIDQINRHVKYGTDMDQMGPDGNRPLHVAAQKGQIAITRLLLKHGVDINALNRAGHTPIYYAILKGRTRLADLLLKHGAQFDANAILLQAAAEDIPERDAIKYLVSQGADLEVVDQQGDTPLITSVRHGNHRLARHLVDQGADVNTTDAKGESVLQIANRLGLRDIALLLERNGATAKNED